MKQDLKNRVRKALLEAPIRYDGPERMDPSLEDLFNRGETPYSKNPALPDKNNDGVPDSFEQIIASKRFKDVIENLTSYRCNKFIGNEWYDAVTNFGYGSIK